MSLRELWVEFDVAKLRHRDEFERDTTLAWQANRIHMMSSKRLPALSALLPKTDGGKKVNWKPSLEEQRANLLEISRRYKIPIKEVPAA